MSYHVVLSSNRPAFIPIGTDFDLEGYSFLFEISSDSEFSRSESRGTVSYTPGVVTVSLTTQEVNSIGDVFFRVKAVGPNSSSFYLVKGYIDNTASHPAKVQPSDLDEKGYLKTGRIKGRGPDFLRD